jgi:hypothetical protein
MKPPYARIIGLILLPSVPILLWLALLSPMASKWHFISDIQILTVAKNDISPDMRVSELANRVTALASTILLLILALPAGGLALVSVIKRSEAVKGIPQVEKWPAEFWVWLGWFAVLAILAIVFAPQVFDLFGTTFNANTIERIDPNLTGLLRLQYYPSVLAAVFGGTALAAAATGIFLRADALSDPTVDGPKIDPLARRLDLVLFATAAILVAGIITVDTWSTWPSPLVLGKDTYIDSEALKAAAQQANVDPVSVAASLKDAKAKELKNNYNAFLELKNGFMAVQSVCYVGGLVLTVLPALLALNAARRRLHVPVATSGLGVDQIFRMLALLSPILAGPIVRFLSIKLGG